ncbi:Lysophospholipase, alpha-beta hydrolase superfamily [Amycolatopsis xylanica]|uniref:Lysophospholipase, alpha-beta hydrolase superfamily n=1 Tax=Amycolatopsis xylanica TaxID=589385 RepID=A0A1H3HEH3_9PSEU|nr:alpha/beta hydrolase [Amycolatopsis xylanica]SDY13983.1 Lysophospholipase, alpha-beta hydrolase superfamily [Amycolatopsis xylanica]
MIGWRKRLLLGVLSAVLGSALLAPPAATAAPPACQDYSVPVLLGLLPQTMHGSLCAPPGATTVQVLVHGGTYSGYYWDFPLQPEVYSYRRAANERGYATFTIDRIGYGQSSRPLSTLLTGVGHASTVHQVIQKLRAGQIGGTPFGKVLLTGHSLGSGTSILEAATYHDVDGVLLTGVTHHLSASALLEVFTSGVYPAALDPKFGLAYEGYYTTVPGKRRDLFYGPHDDPAVIARDEQLKEPVSLTEVADLTTLAFTAPASLNITAPVLIANGTDDALFCQGLLASDCASAANLKAQEAPYYSPAACLRTFVLPGSGHNIALTPDTARFRAAALDWADTFVGTDADKRPLPPAAC